jgi:hypothetical protein
LGERPGPRAVVGVGGLDGRGGTIEAGWAEWVEFD